MYDVLKSRYRYSRWAISYDIMSERDNQTMFTQVNSEQTSFSENGIDN